ncbi:MAG TPA: alpha/beta hydrolase-fold protein [Flavobacteriaceae bacterium]|nr:alpha/beta hydrolase-fold protein [Flavobacteriaceae bacterium]
MKKPIFYLLLAMLFIGCKNKGIIYNDPIPKHDSLTIDSRFLSEKRIINIWTPPGYNTTTDSFPVLYMPDGGIKEDFPHIANTLDTLIKQNKIPKIILVGIENTERGRDLTEPTKIEYDLKYIPDAGGSENFRKFIQNELFPAINQKYRTTDKNALIGESLAGLFVVETFILQPQMFDSYIAMDPSLWFNEAYLQKNFEELIQEHRYQNKKLWFAGSNAEDIHQYTRKLETSLKNSPENLTWKYSDEPNEKHHTIFRATKEKALVWALND